jgi:hypothetical protein
MAHSEVASEESQPDITRALRITRERMNKKFDSEATTASLKAQLVGMNIEPRRDHHQNDVYDQLIRRLLHICDHYRVVTANIAGERLRVGLFLLLARRNGPV